MARVNSLSAVDSSTGECQKPMCVTGSGTLHRHHRRHEAMWLGVWASRRKNEPKYKEFVERYYEFHRDDWVRLCADHHAEVHLLYDGIIKGDRLTTGRPLSKYSWTQAEKLMDKLESACVKWLKDETPGFSPEKLTRLRKLRHDRAVRELYSMFGSDWRDYLND